MIKIISLLLIVSLVFVAACQTMEEPVNSEVEEETELDDSLDELDALEDDLEEDIGFEELDGLELE